MFMTFMCVTMSMSMSVTVSMSSFYMSHKFLHHKKGDNSTEDPQSYRENGALATVGMSMSWLLQRVVRMRFQSMRNEVQESISQEPTRSKTQQDLEQRAVASGV